jgi:hypothetical protein
MKFVILDAGPIISLAMNGLLPILESLKKKSGVEFVITPEVKKEVVDRPLLIKKYEFEGLRVRHLIDNKTIRLSSEFVKNNLLENETNKIMEISNSCLYAKQRISIIQRGEASCLAFSRLCRCENVIAVDERTVRMLVENPDGLKKIMENKLHMKISLNRKNLAALGNFKFIRSAEIAYVAYKKDLFEFKSDKQLLDAILYAVKFTGVAISSGEIEEIKRLA